MDHMQELLGIIKDADNEKLDKCIEFYKYLAEREDAQEFGERLAKAQAEIKAVVKDSWNPQTRSHYASLPAIDAMIREAYTKYGLSLSFDTHDGDGNQVKIIGYLRYKSYEKCYSLNLPTDGKGLRGKDMMTPTHALGSAVAYGRRYLKLMIFDVPVMDDDGNAASGHTEKPVEKITDEQAQEIVKLVNELEKEHSQFVEWVGKTFNTKLDKYTDFTQEMYEFALRALKKRRAEILENDAIQVGFDASISGDKREVPEAYSNFSEAWLEGYDKGEQTKVDQTP